jgi:hypothetical protein
MQNIKRCKIASRIRQGGIKGDDDLVIRAGGNDRNVKSKLFLIFIPPV